MVLSIIVPVFNEKNTIADILKKIEEVDLSSLGFKKEIIIVDDYSTDGTREILKSLSGEYKIVYHSKNQGKGMAVQTGLKEATGDYVIVQDADLEYDPEDYKGLLKTALKEDAKVVYGSRLLHSKDNYSHRSFYLGGLFLTWAANLIYGIKITDESTCYKLFETEFLKSLNLKARGFEFCPEVTAKTAKRGVKIYEVPIQYHPRHVKEGKKIKWKDGLVALWTLIKYKFID
ncbi:MAG: glycosyltransferase family 2 protein [Candidatus Portnoybacteria bacterium]